MFCKSWKKVVIGIDEAGRGSLGGPVVACAVMFKSKNKIKKEIAPKIQNPKFLKDSKKLSPKRREEIFEILRRSPEVEWGIGRVSERVIDKINIFQATKLAMKRAVRNLEKKLSSNKSHGSCLTKEKFLLIDGNFEIPIDIPQKSIIKGDEKMFLIKLASIIAKVTRDRVMARYHKKYPQYRFDKHKGYGTKLHLEMLKKYGPCKIHRKTFKPVQKLGDC
ncbi:MAG: ribonuclease HII [Candidatus Nealsonbacteria bacterium]|nr:MAG: ribonuclease HII [Candidatus Nealsonbacteria bacterium]